MRTRHPRFAPIVVCAALALGNVAIGETIARAATGKPTATGKVNVNCDTGVATGTAEVTGVTDTAGHPYVGGLGIYLGSTRPRPGTTGLDGELATSGAARFSFKFTPNRKATSVSLDIASPTDSAGVNIPFKIKYSACGQFRVTNAPRIDGVVKAGHTVKALVPAWKPVARHVTFQWLLNGKPITNATSSSLTLSKLDRGKKLTVRVVGSRAHFTPATRTSAPKTVS